MEESIHVARCRLMSIKDLRPLVARGLTDPEAAALSVLVPTSSATSMFVKRGARTGLVLGSRVVRHCYLANVEGHGNGLVLSLRDRLDFSGLFMLSS